METIQSKIDLRKKIVTDIAIKKNISNLKAQVVLVLDYSGSMDLLYKNGFVQRLIERLVPLAMQFDDNGEMELYMFENDIQKHKNNVTVKNVDNIIKREITGNYKFGGTEYAPAINKMVEDYCTVKETKRSFFSFGKKETPVLSKDPVYVIFITDGDNSDHKASEDAIKKASKNSIFFQFVGIGNASFKFLKSLDEMSDRYIDNANFFQANDLEKMTDDELYNAMLNEFPSWIELAKQKLILA